MKPYTKIESSQKVHLAKIPVTSKSQTKLDMDYHDQLKLYQESLSDYQTKLYADHKRAVLIIFQGMDTSGKDGAIKHVMSGVNPQGCSVVSFKAPTSDDLNHDFLWRACTQLPAKGKIGIFNRSYYEEVLVTKVHPELLVKEGFDLGKKDQKEFWEHRYSDIVHLEKYLHRQGTEIIKIFLHISKDEQKRRLLSRFNDPKKLWKISKGDVMERKLWNEYQKAYEACLENTASKGSPWYIVPGDNKESARLIISQILIERLGEMKLSYPELNAQERVKLKKLKAQLT